MGIAESGNQWPPQLRLRGGATSALDQERGGIPSPEVPAGASQPGRGHGTDEESSPEVDIIGEPDNALLTRDFAISSKTVLCAYKELMRVPDLSFSAEHLHRCKTLCVGHQPQAKHRVL